MRRNGGSSIQKRKKCGRPPAGHVDLRQGGQSRDRLWAARRVRFLPPPFIPQKIGAPAPRMIQVLPLVERQTFPISNVGFDSFFVGAQHPKKFVSYGVRRSLKRLEPGEILTREEFIVHEVWKEHERRLGRVDTDSTEQPVEAT